MMINSSIAILCPGLTPIENGVIIYSSTTPGPHQLRTMATYSCNPGFGLSGGDSTRTCGGDGSSPTGVWSGTPPTCECTCQTTAGY